MSSTSKRDTRLDHPADRESFRRKFCEIAESQYHGGAASEVTDCAALLRFAYLKTSGRLFDTPNGRQYFADAQTLKERNCHFVGRTWQEARPADLFFYLQLQQDQPFHAMIFLGPSSFDPGPERYAVYHTGAKPGEIRRPRIDELALHPDPRWRPESGNPAFLGVYRWRILAE